MKKFLEMLFGEPDKHFANDDDPEIRVGAEYENKYSKAVWTVEDVMLAESRHSMFAGDLVVITKDDETTKLIWADEFNKNYTRKE